VSQQDRDKWNDRYREGAYGERPHPSQFVERWAPQVVTRARRAGRHGPMRALDLACGAGRNALWLAEAGFVVDALDIAEAGLELARARAEQRGVAVAWHCHDLDAGLPVRFDDYELIVVMRFLDRGLLPGLAERLRPGGCLLCEVHLESDADVIGPRGAAFRVAPGELGGLLLSLEVLEYEEGLFADPDGRSAALARFAGARPG